MSPSEGAEAVQRVWNLNKRELLQNLGYNASAERVKRIIEKYDLVPEDNVGALFRRLYYSQSEEMEGDCGILG